MSDTLLTKGDKVRVTAPEPGESYKVGDILTVSSDQLRVDGNFYAETAEGSSKYIFAREVEPVDETDSNLDAAIGLVKEKIATLNSELEQWNTTLAGLERLLG